MLILEGILWGLAVMLCIPAAVLFIECLAAMLPPSRSMTSPVNRGGRGRVAVLVPAHNEAGGIMPTVRSILPQLSDGDRLLVIADNCADSTARVARDAGADVTERHDRDHRGKGYALAHGVACLSDQPPAVVVVVDADMVLAPGSIDALAQQVQATDRAAQAVNLLDPPPQAGPREHVAALAFAVKNLVRSRGLLRLGLPCQLMGTGMALPWNAIRNADLATGNIVEDMRLGTELAERSQAPLLCEAARVTGRFPAREHAARTQHTRWEQGHLQTLAVQAPRLLLRGITRRRVQAVALAVDLLVPPLSLLVMTLGGALGAAAALAVMAGIWGPLALLVAANVAVVLAVVAAAAMAGGGRDQMVALLAAPLYLAWKVPLYAGLVLRPQRTWHRTEREA